MSVKVQSYSLELKAQAVRMAMEDGLGIKETGKRLSIPSGTLAGWVAKISKEPSALAPGEQIVQVAEVKRLEKENSRLRMELEILKKAAAYFARESLQSTLK